MAMELAKKQYADAVLDKIQSAAKGVKVMTNSEAINVLGVVMSAWTQQCEINKDIVEAFKMAISALENKKEIDNDFKYRTFEGGGVLTNFSASDLEVYQKAIKDFGDDTLYISSIAYDCSGNRLYGDYSLRTISYKDRSEFWKLFDKLSKERDVKQ